MLIQNSVRSGFQSYPESVKLNRTFLRTIGVSDLVDFTSNNKFQKFKSLSGVEKNKIYKLVDDIFYDDNAQCILTLLGKKPCSAFDMSYTNRKTLLAYKNLFDSKNIKIISDYRRREADFTFDPECGFYNGLIINVPEVKKVITKNIDYFRFKLNDKSLNANGVINELFGKNFSKSPVIIDDDLSGILFGFPLPDVLLYHLFLYSGAVLNFLKDTPHKNHKKIVDDVMSTIRPTHYKKATKADEVQIPDINNERLDGFFKVFKFLTWDKNNPELKQIDQNCIEGCEEVKRRFKTHKELLCYILNSK